MGEHSKIAAGTAVVIENPYGKTVAVLRADVFDDPKMYQTGVDVLTGGERGRTEGRVTRFTDHHEWKEMQ